VPKFSSKAISQLKSISVAMSNFNYTLISHVISINI